MGAGQNREPPVITAPLLCPAPPFLSPPLTPQGLPPGDSAPKLELLLEAQCSPLLQTWTSQQDVQREGKQRPRAQAYHSSVDGRG